MAVTNGTVAQQNVGVWDFPVGLATLILVGVSLALVLVTFYISRKSIAEMKAQRGVLERQVQTMRDQLDVQVKPRLSLYQGRSEEVRRTGPILIGSTYLIVVRNSTGGGPALSVNVNIRNTTRNSTGGAFFPFIDSNKESEAGIPGGTNHGDSI